MVPSSYGIALPYTAYVAAFCIENMFVGLPQDEEPSHIPHFYVTADGQLTFPSLSNGLHHIRIINALGELVWQRTLQGNGSSVVSTSIPQLSSAVYVLAVDERGYKFQVTP